MRAPLVVLASGHRLANETEGIDLADLAEDPLVLLDAPPSSNHALDVCRRAGFAPRIAYRTRNYETARAFVGHSLGWTLLLQRPAVDKTYEGRAVVVRKIVAPELPAVAIVVAWHREMIPSRVTRAFIDFATEHYSSEFPNK